VRLTPSRLPLSQATLPNPVRGVMRSWTYPEEENFFKHAALYSFLPKVSRADIPDSLPLPFVELTKICGLRVAAEILSERRTVARAKSIRNDIGECRQISGIDWKTWRPPDYEPSEEEINFWRGQYWSTRTPYDPTEGCRESFCDGWRTERKMRDLAAKLKLNRYGDGHWMPERAQKIAWSNLHKCLRKIKGIRPSFWPQPEPHSSTRDTPYIVVPEANGEWAEVGWRGAPLRTSIGFFRL
jgi:hypothetical protein